jgi:hypothetical protein
MNTEDNSFTKIFTCPPEIPNPVTPNITGVRIEEIDPKQIKPCNMIQDFISPYDYPIPIVVERDDEYILIGGNKYFQEVPEPLENIRCEIFTLADNSDESIALEKINLYVKPTGGSASYGEIVRSISGWINKNSADGNKFSGHGGARRGAAFEVSESMTNFLAVRLGKSPETVRKYISAAKHLTDSCLEELAINKAPRKFFFDIQAKKNSLMVSFADKSDDEMTDEASRQVIKWWKKYVASEANKTTPQAHTHQSDRIAASPVEVEGNKDGEAESPSEQKKPEQIKAAPQQDQEDAGVGGDSQKGQDFSDDDSENDPDSGADEEVADAADEEADSDKADDEKADSEDADEDAEKDDADADADDDSDADAADEAAGKGDADSDSGAAEKADSGAENAQDKVIDKDVKDIASENFSLPNFQLSYNQGGVQGLFPTIYEKTWIIGNVLIKASQEMPDYEHLKEVFRTAIAEISALLSLVSKANTSHFGTTTLSENFEWASSCPSVAAGV